MSTPTANQHGGNEGHTNSPPAAPPSSLTSARSLKQLGLCAAGIGSIILSTVITRRAIARHHIRDSIKIFQPSNRSVGQRTSGENFPLAAEALQVATANLVSWAIMTAGGLSWALDISSFDDLKRYARQHTRGNPDETNDESEEKLQAELVLLMSKYMSDTKVESLLKNAIEEKRAAISKENKKE